jgi:CheY-like chemotaxis protein
MSKQKLVLIIEDAPEIAEIFAEVLQSQGMNTGIVSDGALAMQAITEKSPALILLDMHLPNVSGREILTSIRANPQLAGTRVIAVTADALMAGSLSTEADIVLIKPVTYGQLSDLSKRLLLLDDVQVS